MMTVSLKNIKKLIPSSKNLKILMVATEAAPFAKAGGLGDVVHSLSLALRDLGQDVRIFIPYYGTISREDYKVTDEIEKLKVPTDQSGDNSFLVCAVKKYIGKESAPTYFLENMEYYEQRANVYGYSDDHIRWILLCRGVIEFLMKSPWKPDVIVASDWQTGLISNYLKTKFKDDPDLSKIATIFAIHNMQYQGMSDFKFMPESEKDAGKEAIPEFFNPRLIKFNWLLRGVLHSDLITTVSPNYAKEIMTPEFGEGLDKIFKEKRDKVYGILNGISQDHNSPELPSLVKTIYTSRNISGKKDNKIFLQERFGLPQDPNLFLMCMVTRFTEQKGFDLFEKAGEPIFKHLPVQMIVVGDGEARYKELIKSLSDKYPDKISYSFRFDPDIPHLIFSGSDSLLMPSKFEPCGIAQMQAMRYGCVPIVRKTGGLASTVKDYDPTKRTGDGFVFKDYDPMAFFASIVRATTLFQLKNHWNQIVRRAMRRDFSWEKSAKEYLVAFTQAIKNKNS